MGKDWVDTAPDSKGLEDDRNGVLDELMGPGCRTYTFGDQYQLQHSW